MELRCKNLECRATSKINKSSVYCQYCGCKYSDLGVNVEDLFATNEQQSRLIGRYMCAMLASLVLILFIALGMIYNDFSTEIEQLTNRLFVLLAIEIGFIVCFLAASQIHTAVKFSQFTKYLKE